MNDLEWTKEKLEGLLHELLNIRKLRTFKRKIKTEKEAQLYAWLELI